MAYEVAYRAEWAGPGVSGGISDWRMDILLDLPSAPSIETVSLKAGPSVRMELSNKETLYGWQSHSVDATLVFGDTDQFDGFVSDVFADPASAVAMAMYEDVGGDWVIRWTGWLYADIIRWPLEPGARNEIRLRFNSYMSRLDKPTAERFTGTPWFLDTLKVTGWFFNQAIGQYLGVEFGDQGYAQPIGESRFETYHEWRPNNRGGTLNNGLEFTFFRLTLFDGTGASVAEVTRQLCAVHAMVYAWSFRRRCYTLSHIERFLGTGTQFLLGNSNFTLVENVPQLVMAAARNTGEAAVGRYGDGFGYYEVEMHDHTVGPVVDNIYQREFREELEFTNTAGPAVARLRYELTPFFEDIGGHTYVDPDAVATSYPLGESLIQVIRSTFSDGRTIFFVDLPNRFVDGALPFWFVPTSGAYLVRMLYGTVDMTYGWTRGCQLLVLESAPVGELVLNMGIEFEDGVMTLDEMEHPLMAYDTLKERGRIAYRLPAGGRRYNVTIDDTAVGGFGFGPFEAGWEDVLYSGAVIHMANAADTTVSGSDLLVDVWHNVAGANGVSSGTSRPKWLDGFAADFDGSNDYIEVAHNANQLLTGGGTLMAWVRPDTQVASGRIIIDKSSAFLSTNGFSFFQRGGGAGVETFGFAINGGTTIGAPANAMPNGQWTHVAVVFTAGGGVTLYANGVFVNTGTTGAASGITTTNALRIGNRSGATDRAFDGRIARPMVMPERLTAAQIKAYYDLTQGYFS